MRSDDVCHELRKFAETTGIKGVSRVVKAPNRVVRFFWLAAIVMCSTLLFYQVSSVVNNYISHSVTRINKVNPNTPTFPDVTICNRFPASNLSTDDYYDYLHRVQMLRQYVETHNIYVEPILWNLFKTVEFYNVNSPTILLEELSKSDSFVTECKQYGWDLYWPANCQAVPVIAVPLQKCHRIQLDWTNGTVAAISVVLFTNNFFPMPIDNYDSWIRISSGTGVSVMIHQRSTYPNQKQAIYVSTGNELSLQLQQTNINLLTAPYGNCTWGDDISLSVNTSFLYTSRECISLCRQQQRIAYCGCLDNNELFTEADLEKTNHTFCCNTSGVEFDDPESPAYYIRHLLCMGQFPVDESKCDCPMPCSYTEYGVTVSSSQWPDPLYQLSFYQQFIQNNTIYGTKFAPYDEILKKIGNQTGEETLRQLRNLRLIEDNFVRVTIMFSEETYQVLTDTATTTWDTLVANLGSTFNLWLGISVPTAAEIIELICSILVVLFPKRKAAGNVVTIAPSKR